MSDALPALDRPLGSLDFRVRRTGAADGTAFAAVGRRARAEGTGSDGIETLRMDDARVLRELRVDGARAREAMETPLGVERRLDLGGTRIVERMVVHHDAPVAWVEWVREPDAGAGDAAVLALELSWAVELAVPSNGSGGPPGWDRLDRGIVVDRGDPAVRAFFVLGIPPTGLTVDPAEGALRIRVRCPVPGPGLRMAVVGVGPDDDSDRLLRIAGRTRVAVRGREGTANRLLDEGLRIRTPDPALDRALAAARLRLDAAGLPPSSGSWRTEDAARAALAQLVTGDFGAVLAFLQRLAGTTDSGRVPGRLSGDTAVSHDRGRTGLLFLLLTARYLAWSGDLRGVRELWPDVEAVLRALAGDDAADDGLRATALAALAVAAEEIGESETAKELRRVEGEGAGGGRATDAGGAEDGGVIGAGVPADAAADPAGLLLTHVGRLLAPRPDALRGRLELGPRPPDGWERYEVRGLGVGSAAVDVVYRREGGRHRFEVDQTRGATPLQVVLAPELSGREVAATRVDRKPAGLDVGRADGRSRVPVQLVLDHRRTLEVEFADEPS